MPIFRRTKALLLHLVCCSGSAGCGWERLWGAVLQDASSARILQDGSDSKMLSIGRNTPYSIKLHFNAQNFHFAGKCDTIVPLNTLNSEIKLMSHLMA